MSFCFSIELIGHISILFSHILSFALLQVAKAAEYTEAGTAVLAKAKKLQKNKRKWVTFAILLLLLIIVIIVVPVMQPWKDKKA